MVTAEVKEKSKRIAHRVRYEQVCHNFIHGDGDYFHSHNVHPLWCWGDFIFFGHHYEKQFKACESIDDIKKHWFLYNSSLLGIIDRKRRKLIVNRFYCNTAIELEFNTPKDWKIYKIYEDHVSYYDLFSNDKRDVFNELVLKYHVKLFYECLYKHSAEVVCGRYKTIYYDKERFTDDNTIVNIKNAVKELRCKTKPIYTAKLYEPVYKDDPICPTVKQICENTVFTDEQYTILDKRCFWTNYCFRTHQKYSSFSEVDKYWNTKIYTWSKENFDKRYGLSAIVSENEYPILWQDYIKLLDKSRRDRIKSIIYDCQQKNILNEQEAIENHKDIVEAYLKRWRDNESVNDLLSIVQFDYHYYDRKKDKVIIEKCDVNLQRVGFKTTKLKLSQNKLSVITSRYAQVTIDDAIKMWHFFDTVIKLTDVSNGEDFIKRFDSKTLGCGPYPLVAIKYCDKKCDRTGEVLGGKEWAVVIGCHTLWKDDILEFIHYYNLEDKFGINQEIKNKFKLKLK